MYSIFKITSNVTVDFAAEELKKYIRMMMPRCGEVPTSYNPDAKEGIRIGLMEDFGLDMSDAQNPQLDDIVYVETDEKGGIIAGSNPGATLIAVYRYLRFCGCRWLFPGVDGEWIPTIESLPPVSYRKLADQRYRGQCNEGAEFQPNMIETIDFTPKIGMNTYMIEFDNPYCYYERYYNHTYSEDRPVEGISRETILRWKRQCEVEIQKRGLHYHDMGHGWTAEPFGLDSTNGWASLGDETVPEESIEYLAMLDGERKIYRNTPLMSNVCMSNPKARKIMSEYIADYAEKQNNVDFLHIWLGDASNCHCECDECRKKDTSDWYIMLLNEIDEELTRRNLDTHLVFICYLDTFWAPIKEKLNNDQRFTMLFAPITRLYTETYAADADTSKLTPYNRNHINLPRGMSECLGYLQEWKKLWSGDCFCYEYHFMWSQYLDASGLFNSKIIYDDICAQRKQGLSGIIEDGSQRSFFPTGFAFYVYGETLFDSTVSFEELKADYFSHAFGKDWEKVVDYLEKLNENLDFAYFFGIKSEDPEKGKYYAPSMESKIKKAQEILKDFAPITVANIRQEQRATSVAWQILGLHNYATAKFAEIASLKCVGKDKEAAELAKELVNDMAKREIYFERYYDHFMYSFAVLSYAQCHDAFDNMRT